MRTRNLTLLMTDVKGSTERQSRSSRREIEEELLRHRALLSPIFQAFGGRIVKTMGDAFLVAFESPTDAVHAAVQVQRALAEQNASTHDPARATHVRIAISTGEVSVDDDGDVFGEPVNLASRLEGIAEAGTIYLTETTFLSMNRNEIPALEVGHRVFKGIPAEVKVYRILDEYVANARLLSPDEIRRIAREVSPVAAGGRTSPGGPSRAVLLVAGAALVLGGVAVALLLARRAEPEPSLTKTLKQYSPAALEAGRRFVAGLAKAGKWDVAHDWTRNAYARFPNDAVRDLKLDVARWELEAAIAARTEERLTKQSPSTWFDEHVARPDERTRDAPRYAWLHAVWLLASEPPGPRSAEALERALKVEPDARDDEVLRDLVQRAVAATTGKDPLHGRFVDALALMRGEGDRTPAGGRRGPAMRDR